MYNTAVLDAVAPVNHASAVNVKISSVPGNTGMVRAGSVVVAFASAAAAVVPTPRNTVVCEDALMMRYCVAAPVVLVTCTAAGGVTAPVNVCVFPCGLNAMMVMIYLVTPLVFSNVLKPPMPSNPDTTTHRNSRSISGGIGQPMIVAYQVNSGLMIPT